ncbi:MarR family winged helix-turn-helix transcriptional regulator [Rathayibacter iranicus]|uniref:MarR family transcriptional regulator n=2 Tax=Rathayibacter iranicus TaxID=59737 RepID=A0AAD1ADK4_9MICO|nr:MarR family transcriptional regulator [Rathayibacter iranicus]AZZ56223.1 MarR family transcriptional regulator [Rathayibacter iranicus]MWV30073.1 MarR family transcriptional regulator [Rathayibacter iranicus NCPPB 2253 = VKM Ac-1602]PPI46289.1 MarR family transcriptional regulator [Rathayibacter iranicus]PPI59664.1 MarR family transcriptional regulator [Rathayibacter iranicus]PPI71141.1 MarR family transcriptional regulator [Rathayibacter iranicus]
MSAPENRWLTPDQLDAWLRFIAVVELLPGALDTQLQRDAGLTHFEYLTLAMLSEAPDRALRMTTLAARTNATLPRLSHVVTRLVARGYLERQPCASDGRATNAVLTVAGMQKIVETAPGHVATVLADVIDPLDAEQIPQLADIMTRMLTRLDPEGRMTVDAVRSSLGDPEIRAC